MPTEQNFPKRGEIWWVAFDPSVGGEIQKTRPAVVISNDGSNRHLNRLQVVPLTSRADRLYSAECLLNVGGKVARAIASQVTTASKKRFRGYLGRVTASELAEIEQIIRLQLGL